MSIILQVEQVVHMHDRELLAFNSLFLLMSTHGQHRLRYTIAGKAGTAVGTVCWTLGAEMDEGPYTPSVGDRPHPRLHPLKREIKVDSKCL